jgi:hypothetical protein
MVHNHFGDCFYQFKFQQRFAAEKTDFNLFILRGVAEYKIDYLPGGVQAHNGYLPVDIAVSAPQVTLLRNA